MSNNILIVDDSPTVRKLLTYILKSKNYQCIEASNGIQALEKMALNDVDLAIVDINMPYMDGIELVSNIRKSEKYADLPIIMLTTEANDQSRRKGLEAGANLYLVKPAKPQTLLFQVESLLRVKL